MRFKVATFLGIEVGILSIAFGAICLLEQSYSTFRVLRSISASQQVLISGFCLIVSFYYNDLYDLRVVRNFTEFCANVLPALGIAFFLLFTLFAISKIFPGILVVDSSTVITLLIVVSGVFLIRAVFYRLLRSRTFAERVLILGTSSWAQEIAKEISVASHTGYVVVGFVDDLNEDLSPDPSVLPYPVVGPLDRLERIISELHPDRIIVALKERRRRLPVRELLVARLKRVIVEDSIEAHERFTGKLAIESLNPSFLIFSKDFKISRFTMASRRMTSFVFSVVGLVVTAPLMVLIAVAIKLDSRGPVFFIQKRAGLGEKTFRLVKFRTMHPIESTSDTERSVWGRDSTARITRIGRILRKLRLDELPQFINIIRGDMDLVGPRPEMVDNVKTMTEQIPYYSLRMGVRPGLTGWAQVRHGYSVSQEDVTEKMRYDLYYIKHMSVWFDIKILIDTVKIVLLGKGSEQHAATKSDERILSTEISRPTVSYLPPENSQERRHA